jgi:hypothetical protein
MRHGSNRNSPMVPGSTNKSDTDKPSPAARGWRIAVHPGLLAALVLFGIGGWSWGAYERFIEVPAAAALQKVSTTLDLVDRFSDSEAQRAYTRLSDELKAWFDTIEEQQRAIVAAENDAAREPLIAKRDLSLLQFIENRNLAGDIDTLLDGFDGFERCLAANACDEGVLRKSISIDVKRVYRTFKPFILSRREKVPDDKDLGKSLEALYFRFVG